MKIVCDACSAKYAIADEKVKGKVFKIRCKKCSNVIVVRGNAESEAAEESLHPQETHTYGYDEQGGAEPAGAGGVWHLVIDQDQVGPLTEDEVRQRFARGEIDRDTYAWREGFADWMPLAAIDAFASLEAGGAGGASAASDHETTQASPAADLFSGSAAADQGADLFGTSASSGAGDSLFGSNGSGGEQRMRGERNENSVLFSLNNLAALATEAPKPAASAPSGPSSFSSPPSSSGMAQAGGTEGSGLIDIRSMANAYFGDGQSKGGATASPLSALGPVEPVSFATQSPVLLPQAPPSGAGSNKTLLMIMGAVGGALVIGVVVVLVVVLQGDDGQQVAASQPPATSAPGSAAPAEGAPAGGGDEGPAAAAGAAKTDDQGGEPAPAAGGAKEPEQATGDDETETAAAGGGAAARDDGDRGDRDRSASRSRAGRSDRDEPRRRGGSSRDAPSSRDDDRTPARGRDSSSGSGSGKCLDEVGCLLADKPPACCAKYSGGSGGGSSRRSGGGSSGNSNLPERLTRSDITKGINQVRSRVSSCGGKHPGKGTVKVTVKVAGSGSVSGVTVKSSPSGGLGNCVASAVKRARFSKSQQGATFTYPFVF